MSLAAPHGSGDVFVIRTAGAGIEFAAASGALAARSDEKAMLEAAGRSLQSARLTSRSKAVTQHGMSGFVASGTGQKSGAEVEWCTAALGDGRGHAMLSIGFHCPAISRDVRTEIAHTLESIQPAL